MATSTIFTTPSPFHEFIHCKNCQSNNVIWSLWGSPFFFGCFDFKFLSTFARLSKNPEYMITSRRYCPVFHLESGVGAKCRDPSIVVVSLNTQGFTHRNLTEISDWFHVISENKQFLNSYDFPPLLAEPDLQWWPRNNCAYYAMTIKLPGHCFPPSPFIIIVLDSFDFDQMRTLNFVQFDCLWLFFSKLNNDSSLPLTCALAWLTPMLLIAPVKKYTSMKLRLEHQDKVFDGITWLKVFSCIRRTLEIQSILSVHSFCLSWMLSKHLRGADILPEFTLWRQIMEVPIS